MPILPTTRRTLLGLIGSLAIFRPAQGRAPDSFTLMPQLAEGQIHGWRLELEQSRNGVIAFHTRQRVTLEILEEFPGGWFARWTTHDSVVLEADPRRRPMVASLLSMWDGVPIDLVLDEGGRVVDLVELDEVWESALPIFERIIPLLPGAPAGPLGAEAVSALMESILGNHALLANSLLKEPRILLGAMGQDYRVGEPLEISRTVPSPLNGAEEVPVLGRYTVRDVDVRIGRAELGWLMVIDRVAAARALAPGVQAMVDDVVAAAPSGNAQARAKAASARAALADLDFDDRADFTVDTQTAWPERVSFERRVSSGAMSTVDRVKFVRLAA